VGVAGSVVTAAESLQALAGGAATREPRAYPIVHASSPAQSTPTTLRSHMDRNVVHC
jgi:hypothetical protein